MRSTDATAPSSAPHESRAARSSDAIDVRPNPHPADAGERARKLSDPGFGRVFTDHMIVAEYVEPAGWGRTVLQAYQPLTFDPACAVLHYGQAIFEGFKAYRQTNGGIATFRPADNAKRFGQSAARLAMPAFPVERFVEAADALVRQDRDWVPAGEGQSLYIRPLMIATEPFLGVRPSERYLMLIIACPAGQYFPKGLHPVTAWISEEYVRAALGGTGAAKCAGNYAASLVAQRQAQGQGCEQVVWLDSNNRKYVEEMGGMNIFFVLHEGGKPVVVTPKLTGSLLAGITRDSILRLAKDAGFGAEERTVSVDEWEEGARSGTMTEAFACGTAAVITPIGALKSERRSWTMGDGKSGPITTQLREMLVNIQYGRAADRYGWMHPIL
jgi:branched-chain amino acid aminotransferase